MTSPTPATPELAPTATQAASGLDAATGLKNLQQLIQLRWIAVFGQIVTIEVVHYGFGIAIPLQQMLAVLAALIGFNVLSLLRWRTRRPVTSAELLVGLLVDVGMLTAQLYLSGGAANPFVFLYLLQVILAAVLLPAWATWTLVSITTLCFAGLAIFAQPLPLQSHTPRGLASPYMLGLLVCFALNAALLVFFITRIVANLRERDTRLAALRQRAAEEEHIVRMGLLASGAAHELGTPLSTLAVILGDWQHLPTFSSEPELAEDVAEMQAQVARCKSIVSGILLSAGEARGENSAETTVCTFLDEVVGDWRRRRPDNRLRYSNRFGQDLPMVSDSALKQMIGNVLDNAFEASPQAQWLEAAREGDALLLTVCDEGPGFLPAMLQQLGKPYQSSKGRPGGGLGLFLVVNVARTLGGGVTARNRDEGGAELRITLPLTAIVLPDEDPEHVD
ncbi:ATP-binding protein [Xenophilus arseniciresistens]|uniref:histidine kinase n=1 Tax=Xenophilus arseniciresistens TaxID=1283306 RepID=A0AAE3N3C2_9BURK|nr:ATP-binding protein [Xenophilus arseniciresistens]MDA7414790.1 ATP-binding protein [Xenophilus arseniciresistens]